MRTTCANCRMPMVVGKGDAAAPDDGPHRCARCIEAIALLVDYVAQGLVAEVLVGMAEEALAARPPVGRIGEGGDEDGALDESSAAPGR